MPTPQDVTRYHEDDTVRAADLCYRYDQVKAFLVLKIVIHTIYRITNKSIKSCINICNSWNANVTSN